MLMTSILLILWKETESCTAFMSAFYILCLVVSLFFFFGPNYWYLQAQYGYNGAADSPALDGHIQTNRFFMTLFILVLYVGMERRVSLLYNSSVRLLDQAWSHSILGIISRSDS